MIIEPDINEMNISMINCAEDLKTKIERNWVVSVLCVEPTDLKMLEMKLIDLQISFVLYCPFDPYNHSYDVIKDFLLQVDKQRRGRNS